MWMATSFGSGSLLCVRKFEAKAQREKRSTVEYQPIGVIHTCFKEKFGIPRQPGLVSEAKGVIRLNEDPFLERAVFRLEEFSHIWVIFAFHRADSRSWKPSIRPPRLGGAERVGVLASRSPHRPNPIGMSAVRLLHVDRSTPGGVEIHVSGVDILDGSPVLDLKPYIPYADSIPEAKGGWASDPIERASVEFTPLALEAIDQIVRREGEKYRNFQALITQLLELDPRPAFQSRKDRNKDSGEDSGEYGFRVLDYDVKWRIEGAKFLITDVVEWRDGNI